jgi:hypothetical protein
MSDKNRDLSVDEMLIRTFAPKSQQPERSSQAVFVFSLGNDEAKDLELAQDALVRRILSE